MNEMTLTLNGKLINAKQCTDLYESIPDAVKCTVSHVVLGAGQVGEELSPVPRGLQVFGPSVKGVPIAGGRHVRLEVNDWYLQYPGETHGIVLDNSQFCFIFASELGQ